ncbi:galanin receptor 2a-like [Diadema antillarum]|uniref:galanin receptor 2a-like n=1 Tax=Diadema antillarum TaxID=105358 RepID=UPI003A853A23
MSSADLSTFAPVQTTTSGVHEAMNGSDNDWVRTPMDWQWWRVITLLLSLVGIVGNLLVMLVLLRPRRSRSSTDTLIAGLAVADFFTSIFIFPLPEFERVPSTLGAQFYCRIIFSHIFMWTSICASIFTLTTISVERLLAVRFPFTFKRLFTDQRTKLTLVLIWLFAALINTQSTYVTFIRDNKCVVEPPTPQFQQFIGVFFFLVEYLLPVVTMITAHVLTIRSLNNRAQALTTTKNRRKPDLKLLEARRRVVEMLFLVLVTFIICWTPDQFGFLALSVGIVDFSHLYSPLYRTLVVLAFVNSCANPVIYAARNVNFRTALKELFRLSGKDGIKSKAVFAVADDSSKASTEMLDKSDTGASSLDDLDDPA